MAVTKIYNSSSAGVTQNTSTNTLYTVPSGKVAQIKFSLFSKSYQNIVYLGFGAYNADNNNYGMRFNSLNQGDAEYGDYNLLYSNGVGHSIGKDNCVMGMGLAHTVYAPRAEYGAGHALVFDGTANGAGRRKAFGEIFLIAGEKITWTSTGSDGKVFYRLLVIEEDNSA